MCFRLVYPVRTSAYKTKHLMFVYTGGLMRVLLARLLPTYASLPNRELPAFNLQAMHK